MPIKTKHLCAQCKYGLHNQCSTIRYKEGCKRCKVWDSNHGKCLCPTIEKGTNCDYFVPNNTDTTWGYTYDGCEHCRGRAYTEELFEVITQAGVHVKTQFNFCPNCGRNMKGETKC